MDKFLSAQELGITDDEHHYLLRAHKVLQENRRRKVIQIPADGKMFFNMGQILRAGTWWETEGIECDACGCIAGLCIMLARLDGKKILNDEGGREIYGGALSRHQLSRLFYPRNLIGDYRSITVAQAAKALRHFLLTGDADEAWRRVAL